MSELTPEARAIIDAASVGDAPPSGAKKRIHAAVLAGLATGAAEGTAVAATTSAATWSFGLKLLLPVIVIGLGTGGAYLAGAFDDEPSAASQPPPAASHPPPAASHPPPAASHPPSAVSRQPQPQPQPPPQPPPPEPAPEPTAKKITRAKPAPRPLPVPKPVLATAASIREERAIILRARKALTAGDHAAALAIAGEHADQFPSGQLTQERESVRVRALCGSGDATARNAAEKFLARWPKSPYAAKVRAGCTLEEQP